MAERRQTSVEMNEDRRLGLVQELTTRAVEQIYPSREALETELMSGRQLRVYMGIDPTSPDMHVGHQSQLLKLRRLQTLGHHVTLLIGDFTAMIGDPTDKSATRVKLTRDQVLENADGYRDQASKIIDFDDPDNPAELRYNSDWLGEMDFGDVLELASEYTVQQMLERDMFRRRIAEQKPVGLHEFLYPLMQGWDSVQLDTDIEIGGSDQIFNMLVGTSLVKRHLGRQKFVIAGNLLVDPSGKKIGKTEGNMITMNDEPLDMFHKVMLWGDEITPHALELSSSLPMSRIREIEEQMKSGELSGLDAKRFLARTIVSELHDAESAQTAEENYKKLTSENNDEHIKEIASTSEVLVGQDIVSVLVAANLAGSNSQARRLIEGGAVRINGEKIGSDWRVTVDNDSHLLQVGKKKLENHRKLVVTANDVTQSEL
jgi:tyrosyl-tRNA synthetase